MATVPRFGPERISTSPTYGLRFRALGRRRSTPSSSEEDPRSRSGGGAGSSGGSDAADATEAAEAAVARRALCTTPTACWR